MSSISYISNKFPRDANTICSVHVFVCILDVNMKYVFTLNHSKNILKTLPREIPSSLILSCLHKKLHYVPILGMRFDFFQEAEGLYTVPNHSARNKPQVLLFEAPSPQCLRCYLSLSTSPAGFPSNSGLLTWGLFETTRDLASPSPSLGYLVSFFSYWFRVSLPWKTGTAGNADLILSGFSPDRWR